MLRNSRILGLGILDFLWGAGYFFFRNSRIPCDEIPQSSWGMTKKVKPGDDTRQVWMLEILEFLWNFAQKF